MRSPEEVARVLAEFADEEIDVRHGGPCSHVMRRLVGPWIECEP